MKSNSYRLLPVLLCLIILCTTACHKNNGTSPKSNAATTPTQATSAESKLEKDLKPTETYTAKYLDGTSFNSDTLAGKKILFAFFSSKHKDSVPMLRALQKIASYESANGFKIIAVSIDYNDAEGVKAFIQTNGVAFPVLLDNTNLDLASKLNVENEVALIGLDNKHKPAFGVKRYAFTDIPGGEDQFLNYLKETLNIHSFHGAIPQLGLNPVAPDFSAVTTNGKKIKLSDYRGKVVLVIFFSPKCSHCQAEIKHLRESVYPMFKNQPFEIIAVSVFELTGEMLDLEKALAMPWPVIEDQNRSIRSQYSSELGVPENFYVGKDGKVYYTSTGYNTIQDNVILMRIRHLLGIENPPILSDKHFNGVDSCMICHQGEYASWTVTPHAHAYETLQIKGEENNPSCVSCHSLGMNDDRGWKSVTNKQTGEEIAHAPEPFQNVQCENCHAPESLHKGMPVDVPNLKNTCLKCHTEKFSLHFDYADRLARVSHANAPKILAMSESERVALLKKVTKNPEQLFGKDVKYVGNDTCLPCHEKELKSWQHSVHAPTAPGTTTTNQSAIRQDFNGASCESCHGPGGNHIVTKKKEDIRSLGDDCPFCVIEQVCMSCHDSRHDAGFNLATDLPKIKGHK